MIKIGASPVSSLFTELQKMVLESNFGLEKALQFFTINVAKALNIYPKKGYIGEGADADLIIIDDSMNLVSVIAKGKLMLYQGQILVKGTYE